MKNIFKDVYYSCRFECNNGSIALFSRFITLQKETIASLVVRDPNKQSDMSLNYSLDGKLLGSDDPDYPYHIKSRIDVGIDLKDDNKIADKATESLVKYITEDSETKEIDFVNGYIVGYKTGVIDMEMLNNPIIMTPDVLDELIELIKIKYPSLHIDDTLRKAVKDVYQRGVSYRNYYSELNKKS